MRHVTWLVLASFALVLALVMLLQARGDRPVVHALEPEGEAEVESRIAHEAVELARSEAVELERAAIEPARGVRSGGRYSLRLAGTLVDPHGAPTGTGSRSIWADVYLRAPSPSNPDGETILATTREIRPGSNGRFELSPGMERTDRKWTWVDTCEKPHRKLHGELDPRATLVVVLRFRTSPSSDLPPYERGGVRVENLDDLNDVAELGAASIEAWPILVAGRVVDENMRPLVGARVTVDRPRLVQGLDVWKAFEGEIRTDEHGWFEMRAEEWPRELRVRVSALGYRPDFAPGVFPGRTGLAFMLRQRRFGSIAGAIACDATIDADSFVVHLEGPEGPIECFPAADTGAFAFNQVPIGEYTVEVRTRGTRFVVVRLDDVRIEPDQECEDPRLDLIDVRGQIETFPARLLSPGYSTYGARRLRVEDWSGAGGVVETGGDGSLALYVPTGTSELFAFAPGFARASLAWNATVVLAAK